MQKTKLGISVELLGASICLTALFGGLTPTILLAGYVLLMEKDEWLRRCAVKALAVLLMIAFGITVVGLIPDLLSWISSIVRVFKGNFDYSFISSISPQPHCVLVVLSGNALCIAVIHNAS